MQFNTRFQNGQLSPTRWPRREREPAPASPPADDYSFRGHLLQVHRSELRMYRDAMLLPDCGHEAAVELISYIAIELADLERTRRMSEEEIAEMEEGYYGAMATYGEAT